MRTVIVEKISEKDKQILILPSEQLKKLLKSKFNYFKNKSYFRCSKRLKTFFDLDDVSNVVLNKTRFGYGNFKIII